MNCLIVCYFQNFVYLKNFKNANWNLFIRFQKKKIKKVSEFVNECYSKSLYYWAENNNSHVINNRMPLGYSHQETLEDLCNLVDSEQYGETIFYHFFEE